jgi:2'-5' RNA ligase
VTAAELRTITGIVILVPEVAHLAPFAHVTLLAPFGRDSRPTAEEIGEVERFFADVTPFDFTLTGESTFPSGIRYLCPEPASTFSRLTHRLHDLFPEYPPYEGAFDLVVPHLTISPDAAVPAGSLPVRAQEAVLLHHDAESGEHRVTARFPFGTSAA